MGQGKSNETLLRQPFRAKVRGRELTFFEPKVFGEKEEHHVAGVEIEVPARVIVPREDWLDFLLKHNDIFLSSYIGYWAMGMRPKLAQPTPESGDVDHTRWIIVEDDGRSRRAMDKLIDEASDCLIAGKPLPEGAYLLDEAAAIRAYAYGVQRWGEGWFESVGDANTYDIVLQLALLGELRYS